MNINVTIGPQDHGSIDFRGSNVRELRNQLGSLFGSLSGMAVYVDRDDYASSQRVDDNFCLREADDVEFRRESGDKG